MGVTMPPSFPLVEFRAFGKAMVPFFSKTLSDEDLNDPLKRRMHNDWSYQAVLYRYRLCSECNDEFKELLANPSQLWTAGWGDEEFSYKLERCIYTFFMAGLSVFDSFAYCLYFLGHATQPTDFPYVAKPRKITRKATGEAFAATFPQEPITALLAGLSSNTKFSAIDELRNILGHRLSGRHSVRSSGTLHADGTHTTDFHEETWYIPGAAASLTFDPEMLQRFLDDVASLVKTLTDASLQFANSHKPVVAP